MDIQQIKKEAEEIFESFKDTKNRNQSYMKLLAFIKKLKKQQGGVKDGNK